jgi:hypothetical protein
MSGFHLRQTVKAYSGHSAATPVTDGDASILPVSDKSGRFVPESVKVCAGQNKTQLIKRSRALSAAHAVCKG